MHAFAMPCATPRVPAPHAAVPPFVDLEDDDLPVDPRTWCRQHVSRWVSRCGGRPERFPCNGKALCLMTADMFDARVPTLGSVLRQLVPSGVLPCNGKALCLMTAEMFDARVPTFGSVVHQDFRRRLARAIALQELLEKLKIAANKQ